MVASCVGPARLLLLGQPTSGSPLPLLELQMATRTRVKSDEILFEEIDGELDTLPRGSFGERGPSPYLELVENVINRPLGKYLRLAVPEDRDQEKWRSCVGQALNAHKDRLNSGETFSVLRSKDPNYIYVGKSKARVYKNGPPGRKKGSTNGAKDSPEVVEELTD